MEQNVCNYPGCELSQYCKRLCTSHYNQQRKYGEPRPLVDWTQIPCRGPGCHLNATGRSGYCKPHRNQMAHTGKGARKLRIGPRAVCAANSCAELTSGAHVLCRAHRTRDNALRRKYGTDLVTLEAMTTHQSGACLICRTPGVELHVDHDHATGKVRGLLCGPCNRAIGLMKDDCERLIRAARYLGCSDRHQD